MLNLELGASEIARGAFLGSLFLACIAFFSSSDISQIERYVWARFHRENFTR
jgi:hypothetical protein